MSFAIATLVLLGALLAGAGDPAALHGRAATRAFGRTNFD